jgi:hypothetical protein
VVVDAQMWVGLKWRGANPPFRSVLTWPAAPAYGCRSPSDPDETPRRGGRQSYAAKRSPLLEEDRGPPEESKFPMRAAPNHSIPTAVGPPQPTARGGGPT